MSRRIITSWRIATAVTSNYLILGALLEEVTGQPYATVIRERISEPLGLLDTYVPHYEDGPAPFDPYMPQGDEDYDYTSLATATWSAGAIVSSAPDLHTLFRAFFDQEIVSAEAIEIMATGEYADLRRWDQSGVVGHDGWTPGYNTVVLHSPEIGVTTFLASTDDFATTNSAFRAMIDGLAARTSAAQD